MDSFRSKVPKATRWSPKFAPEFTVSRVYGKPLTKALQGVRLERAFQLLSRDILKRVRAKILQTAFSDAAKKRLAKALKVKVGPSSLQIVVKDPLWRYLLDGRKEREMTWLRKARKPIPIVTETGKVIFRSGQPGVVQSGPREGATPRWYFPGRDPVDVMSHALKESRKVIRAKLAKEVAQQMQKRMG